MTYSLGIFSVEVLDAAAASTTAQRQENLQGGIHNTSEGGKKPPCKAAKTLPDCLHLHQERVCRKTAFFASFLSVDSVNQ